MSPSAARADGRKSQQLMDSDTECEPCGEPSHSSIPPRQRHELMKRDEGYRAGCEGHKLAVQAWADRHGERAEGGAQRLGKRGQHGWHDQKPPAAQAIGQPGWVSSFGVAVRRG
jgi:hypothetical protein